MAGGGSGGHIAPLLPLARALKQIDSHCRVIYIGLRGDKLEGIKNRFGVFDEVYFVTSGKFRRYHGESFLAHLVDLKTVFLNVRDFFKVLYGTLSALRLLRRLKPDVLFSKGGYVVVPIGLAAHMLKVPIITHDSDVVPGLANRLVGRWADLHTTGQPAEHYSAIYPAETVKHVGIPIDERIQPLNDSLQSDYRRELDIPVGSFVLLVAGGGLGSKTLNEKILAIAPKLLTDREFFILHFAGQQHKLAVRRSYEQMLSDEQLRRVKVLGFSDEFYKYSAVADLVIARAGASTLAELAMQKKACIILPAKFLSAGHQLKNTAELKRRDAAIVEHESIDELKLFAIIKQLMQNQQRCRELAENLGSLAKPEAAHNIAELILGKV